MRFDPVLLPADEALIERRLIDFLPPKIYDIHAHLLNDAFTSRVHRWPDVADGAIYDAPIYATAIKKWLPAQRVGSLFFGEPSFQNDRPAINEWVASEAAADGPLSRSLCVVSPDDDREQLAELLRGPDHVGLKPYYVYSGAADMYQATVEEIAPEWMWELCHETNGIMVLHIMRDRAISDEGNQQAIRRLCRAYPKCRLILAHIARSFNYRHAFEGLQSIVDLGNAWVDTSAITEMPAFSKAFELLGTQRVLFGTDYPICQYRGKCTAVGNRFHWTYDFEHDEKVGNTFTLVGIESLLCLREACEARGLTADQIRGVFHDNALEILAPHLAL